MAAPDEMSGDRSSHGEIANAATVASAGRPATRAPEQPLQLTRGTNVDHFVVLGPLGSGGMGVVVSAYDPDLDRKVAIKVLRAGIWTARGGTEGRTRLLREAQAMAKLSHPNVITVYEVGTVADQVFVAMEYVEGHTLKEWVCDHKPSWREIVAHYLDAGRGLAAAHEAGLVHRDFKPDNVLIGKDRRVRVTDFGLVGTADVADTKDDDHPQFDKNVLHLSMTKTGSIMGTPAYMSPEQLARAPIEAASDQFSYGVSLYEALYGERPFAGDNYEELAHNVLDGAIREAPRGSDVPPWVRAVVLRSLERDPTDRYPSMAEMLAALERDPAATRRRWIVAAAFVALAGVAGFGLLRATRGPAPSCGAAEERLAGLWDDDLRARTKAAFAASGRPYAPDTYRRTAEILDRYTAEWSAMRIDACEATHVRGEQSADLLDLRMGCLDRRLDELRALTELFAASPDGEIVDHAVEAAGALTSVQGCADADALRTGVPPPPDAHTRQRVGEARAQLDRVEAYRRAGKYQSGLELARATAEEARAIAYDPLLAEATLLYGSLLRSTGAAGEAEASLRESARAAAAASNDRHLATVWIDLVYLVGHDLARFSDARELARQADTALVRAGDPAALRARLLKHRAIVEQDEADYAEANTLYERAMRLVERAHGKDSVEAADILVHHASTVLAIGDAARAEQMYGGALQVFERTIGPDHPRVASCLNNLGVIARRQGHYLEARRYYERALAIELSARGPEHPAVAAAYNNLGAAVRAEGKYAEAQELFERALELKIANLGPDHPRVATSHINLAVVLRDQGHHDKAIEQHQRALEILEKSVGPEHPHVAATLQNMAGVHLDQKRYHDSLKLYRRAIAIYEKALGTDHGDLVNPLLSLGECYLATGKPRQAVIPLERAVKIGELQQVEPIVLADARYILAKALWETRGGRARAVELARAAREIYTANAATLPDAEEVGAWLHAHGH